MARWRRQYREFAGPRYPSLIGYAELLTGSRDTADALVNHALRRTFGRWRRLGTDVQVEAEIRRLIVARFLATPGAEDVTQVKAAVAADPVVLSAQPAEQMQQPEVDPALYAPPGAAGAHTGEFLRPPVINEANEPRPRHAAEAVKNPHSAISESERTHAALAMLTPQARAVVVLRHYDGLAPGLIAMQLGLPAHAVVDLLRSSHATCRAQLGITIPDEPDYTAAPGDGSQHVMVMPHAGSR